MVKEPSLTTDIENLDLYYEDCVIGGPGAFIMTIKDREKSPGRSGPSLFSKLRASRQRADRPAAGKEPRVPCLIGEKSQERAAVSVETIIQSRRANVRQAVYHGRPAPTRRAWRC